MTTTTPIARDGVKTIDQMVDERGVVDNRTVFDRCWAEMGRLQKRLADAFPLTPTPYSRDYSDFRSDDGEVQGSLTTYTGETIDWLVHSWLGSPQKGFTNMHLNVWASPALDIPHLTVVFGTIPDLFFYLDYPARVDLMTDTERLDRFYGGVIDDIYLELAGTEGMKPFISRTPYMRAAISPSGSCYHAEPTEAHVEQLFDCARRLVEEWMGFARSAVRIEDEAIIAANRERDLFVRRTVAQRDPANVLPERFFGKEMADELVGALWGLPRTSGTQG